MFNRKIWTISWKIHRPYEWMAIGGWTPTYTKEVTGNWYIDLTDAVANKLLELKAYWWCEQASTPTPTTPVDIVCNNWTLKVRKESWLPFRYKKVEYITASWTQWLNTWIKLASTDIVETEFRNSSSSWYWALYWVFAVWDSSAFYANWTYYWYDVVNNKVNTWVNVDTSRHSVRQDFGNWVITLDGANTTYTPFTFDNNKDNYLFSRYYSNSYWYWFKGSCRKYKIYRWWELICDLIPVIDTQNNNEPWMYDLVSGDFRWNVWTWNFTAWANAQDDIEVYVDKERYTIGSSAVLDWYSVISNNWTIQTATDRCLFGVKSDWVFKWTFKVKAGQSITVKAKINNLWSYLVLYNSETINSTNYIKRLEFSASTLVDWYYTRTVVCDTDWYAIFQWTQSYSIMWANDRKANIPCVEKVWYSGWATATCEDLLWVWDYKDEQEILSGDVTIKCWVAVLDWTENWTQTGSSSGYVKFWTEDVKNATWWQDSLWYSTHYNCAYANTPWNFYWSANLNSLQIITESGTTLSDFKSFLANQLSAWTPVIVVYPLATPTTLSVAWQTLSIPAWDSRIEIVEWSILDLPLYAKYKSTTE